MPSNPLALLALAVVLVVGACSRSDESTPAQEGEQANGAEKAVQRAPAKAPAKRTPPDGASPAQAAVAGEEKMELRFDMTEDGRHKSAEEFDQWLDERGVTVAEGTRGATGSAKAEDDSMEASANVPAGPVTSSDTRR